MDYVAPQTLDEAYRALAVEDARCLAGGQSLVAMMNLGLLEPARLVSLRRISALRGILRQGDGSLRIGAMTTHAELAALDVPDAGPALLAQAARVVAYPAVRAVGTSGGSVAHSSVDFLKPPLLPGRSSPLSRFRLAPRVRVLPTKSSRSSPAISRLSRWRQ
jgi:aerobic carbon-monoxide dehydrogenase medium subunit